jgi:hypothetical protein
VNDVRKGVVNCCPLVSVLNCAVLGELHPGQAWAAGVPRAQGRAHVRPQSGKLPHERRIHRGGYCTLAYTEVGTAHYTEVGTAHYTEVGTAHYTEVVLHTTLRWVLLTTLRWVLLGMPRTSRLLKAQDASESRSVIVK